MDKGSDLKCNKLGPKKSFFHSLIHLTGFLWLSGQQEESVLQASTLLTKATKTKGKGEQTLKKKSYSRIFQRRSGYLPADLWNAPVRHASFCQCRSACQG